MGRWVHMRTMLGLILLAAMGCAGKDAAKDLNGGRLTLPQVYPLVRASTPSGLIADPKYQPEVSLAASALVRGGRVRGLPQALGGEINLAVAVQERLYMGGPTELLRIVKDLDDRVAGLDTDASKHECLTATPVDKTYSLPGGQTFNVKLQCLQSFGAAGSPGAGWVAFGFAHARVLVESDAGAVDTGEPDDDFYLVEGQATGMGGAYHVQRTSGTVEAWIAVADSVATSNSQVIMHLATDKLAATSELALAGSGVGFCAAHLQTSADFIFIQGKTNGVPPPGTSMMPGVQYCDALRAGCFAVGALDVDLGGDAPSCTSIASSAFAIHSELDASNDATANVMPASVFMYFNQMPLGVSAF
jgi:hypothetical protein